MKECLCCNKKKLFLKLTQGLCPECFEEYRECEEEYKNLVRKASIPTADANNLISSIKILSRKMDKFDDADTIIKGSNCNDLLKIVYEVNNISLNLTINKIASDTIEEDIKPEVQLTSSRNLQKEDKEKNSVPVKKFNSHEMNVSKANLKSENEKTIEIEPVKQSINPQLYIKGQELISKINNATNNVDDEAYYTFLLNEIYNKSLKKCSITSIDDIEIEPFLNSHLNKISISLNVDKKDLYSYYNYVTFSLETTGINFSKNDILEIAAVKVRFGQIESSFKTFVNSGKTLGLPLQQKTGISNEDISKAPDLSTCLKNFQNFVGDFKLISHNNNLHFGFLNYYYKKVLNEDLKNTSACSIKLFRKRFTKYYGEPPRKFDLNFCANELLDKKVMSDVKREKSTTLQNAMKTFYIYEILKKRYK